MKKVPVHTRPTELYFISFIEGGVVMVTEIAGAKMLTPFFGASLYSWAATLSITLFALMTGYYFGGYVTLKSRFASSTNIMWVFLLSGLAVLLMPSLSHFIMKKTIAFSFFAGLMISEMFFLYVPIFLMGMISPMIIFQITKTAELSGRSAGNIYAISTCGGILFTLVFGFLIIPAFGITFPVRVLGFAVTAIALGLLLKAKIQKNSVAVAGIIVFVSAVIGFGEGHFNDALNQSKVQVVERSEGLLGELKVTDELTYPPNGEPTVVRKLKTNNITQNFVFRDMPTQSLLYYVNFTRQLVKSLPHKSSALLVGLGAGSLYKVLKDNNMDVETVEIDQRIYDIGVKYFSMPAHGGNYITDGRYFLNITKKKYDIIIIDAIIGENIPGQLITLESFRRCFQLLNDFGTLIIEHGGLRSFSDNTFIPSVNSTLNAAGFKTHIFNPMLLDNYGDVMFVGTKYNINTHNIRISNDVFIKGGPLSDYELPVTAFDNSHPKVFTDDMNDFDIILKSHYFEMRKGIRKELAQLNF